MKYLNGEHVAAVLKGLISEKHQRHDFETDLTVAIISRVSGGGVVDFGGSEERPADITEMPPTKRDDTDQYGWWDLDAGSYMITYNEVPALEDHHIAFVQPHERLIAAGATHPSFHFRAERRSIQTMLSVGSGGVQIKENARISKLLIIDVRDR